MSLEDLLPKSSQPSVLFEKKHKIAYWLSLFQYSTRSILLSYLERKDKCVLRSVSKGDFLKYLHTDMVAEQLAILGKSGHVFASENFDFAARNNVKPSGINQSLIRHELALQRYLISRVPEIENIRTARQLDYADKRKLPDAIIRLKNSSEHDLEAIEIERVHKSNMRVFQAFYNHAYTIAKLRYYDTVTYVFPTQVLLENYLAKFQENEWPVYKFNTKSRRYVEHGDAFMCPDNLRKRFNFCVMEMD